MDDFSLGETESSLPVGLKEQERSYILCHEQVHIARKIT